MDIASLCGSDEIPASATKVHSCVLRQSLVLGGLVGSVCLEGVTRKDLTWSKFRKDCSRQDTRPEADITDVTDKLLEL